MTSCVMDCLDVCSIIYAKPLNVHPDTQVLAKLIATDYEKGHPSSYLTLDERCRRPLTLAVAAICSSMQTSMATSLTYERG